MKQKSYTKPIDRDLALTYFYIGPKVTNSRDITSQNVPI